MAHLGGFSEEALLLFQHAASEKGYDFSEVENTYDFTRCVRPNGTAYGTRGNCKKGTEEAKSPTEKLKAGSANNPAVKRREADKALATKKTADMRARSAERVKADKRDRALTPKEEAEVDAKTGRNRPSRVAESAQREQMRAERVKRLQGAASRGDKEAMAKLNKMRSEGKIGKEPGFAPGQKARNEAKETANVKAGKSPTADVKPARKPRATSGELRESQRALFDDAKAKRTAAKEAEKAFKQVEKETKGDKSPGARKRRLAAGRAWDKANTAADRAQTKWEREHSRWSKASDREKRAKMSPAQRAEARRIDKVIREQG